MWMISLFLGVSEAGVAVAVTQATGWIQTMLAIFAVAFPTAVSTAFFVTLWRNNKVLYAPGDFTQDTPVHDFVEAMNRTNRRSIDIVESALHEGLTSLEHQLQALGASAAQREQILESVSSAARRAIINVDITAFDQQRRSVDVPVDERATVTELLDTAFIPIAHKVPEYSYGKTWLLRDIETGKTLSAMGTIYARKHLGTDRDYRTLSEVGIEPGSRLMAVSIG